MRWLLALAFVASAGITTWLELRNTNPEGLEVEVDVGHALPELSDAYNVVFDRLWFASADIAIHTPARCDHGLLDIASRDGALVTDDEWAARRAVRLTHGVWANGRSARVTAVATCREGPAAGLRGSATAELTIPRTTCAARPIRVLEIDGEARADGDVLAEGDPLPEGTVVHVTRGRAIVGAPECNGYHALLRRGVTAVGGYDPNGRGQEFRAPRIVIPRADDHAGGWSPLDLDVRVFPEGRRCAECPLPRPAAFAARTGGKRAAVRVYAASVLVGSFNARYVRVRAGEQLFVRCDGPSERCRLGRPILYQPREPFTLVRHRRVLRRTITGRARPAPHLLVPPRARGQIREVRANGDKPELLVVLWDRATRTAPYAEPELEKGLFVWRSTQGGWRIVYALRVDPVRYPSIVLGDVTRDGHADILLAEATGGSGGCATHRVLGYVGERVQQIFVRNMCETSISARYGDLVVAEPIGPCPFEPGPAHCFGGMRTETWRWNRRQLVRARVAVRCHSPRLDPARDCRRRR